MRRSDTTQASRGVEVGVRVLLGHGALTRECLERVHGTAREPLVPGGGIVTLYGHMQWGSLRVSAGETVTAGTPIGAEGNTGKSFGCHLHFEVRQSGNPIPPEPFMAARGLPLK